MYRTHQIHVPVNILAAQPASQTEHNIHLFYSNFQFANKKKHSLKYYKKHLVSRPLLLQWYNGTWLERHLLDEPTPNIRITAVDGNVHTFTFADFLKIWFKFAIHLDGNPARDRQRETEKMCKGKELNTQQKAQGWALLHDTMSSCALI